MELFIAALDSWESYYFMLGGSAAALIGLMLIALSLGLRIVSETTLEDIKAFATPSVLYFVWVFMLSAAMLVPSESPLFLSIILLPSGVVGLVWAFPYVRRLIRAGFEHQDFLLSDWLSQVILPVGGFILMILTSIFFYTDQAPLAFGSIWLSSVALLIAAITNTWSMVIWIIEAQQTKGKED